jgi:hypothetical protein
VAAVAAVEEENELFDLDPARAQREGAVLFVIACNATNIARY